jgi:Ca2+-binding RTX toxin-like protein
MAIIEGTAGEDTLVGTEDADEIFGRGGNDILEGGAGDDFLEGGAGEDILFGGDGDDMLFLGVGDDQLFGGDGYDWAVMGAWPSYFDVKRGPDGTFIVTSRNGGYSGTDVLTDIEWLDFGPDHGFALADLAAEGTAGNDVVVGGSGIDWLYGHDGDDVLRPGAGMNLVNGGAGTDTVVYSGSSSDYRVYFYGDDLYVEWATVDGEDVTILGLDLLLGVEEIYFEGDSVTVTLADVPALGTAASEIITGTTRPDVLFGTDGDDEIYGLGGRDVLSGGAGSDLLSGGDGADYIFDEEGGDDIFIGGGGADWIAGGQGADVFVYLLSSDTGTGTGADWIWGFTPGDHLIDLSALDADGSAAGNQAFAFIGGAAFSATAGELRYAEETDHGLIQWDTDGDGAADGEIAIWSGWVPLIATDFVL